MPDTITDDGGFEENLQHFTAAARLLEWQTDNTDNELYSFALRLKRNALHFYKTLTVAQQQDFNPLAAAFPTLYPTNIEVLKAKLKATKQRPNQTISVFLCDVRTLAKREYRKQPVIEVQVVLIS